MVKCVIETGKNVALVNGSYSLGFELLVDLLLVVWLFCGQILGWFVVMGCESGRGVGNQLLSCSCASASLANKAR